jgi:hypothetical protein
MPTKKNDLLSSWKEIASYLDCDVRTAHRWEKEYGLPVHRLGQGSRARVFAYEHELEAWLRRKSDGENEDDSLNFWTKALAILAGLIILGGISYFVYTYITFDREPFDFDINRSELIILNQDGQELWRYDFPIDYNLNEQLYLNRFQNKIFSFPLRITSNPDKRYQPGQPQGSIICSHRSSGWPSFLFLL